ncbi:ThiF_family protein [Hexamita inflata]|uniref:NEDD8-activating enzyme E1 catalytic subunit n=1 Tax=Hexamita inflata TaxID=28002 RepID=A0AA86V410_9EUKA|nr:ThiF family protein [Hexamita inflata]
MKLVIVGLGGIGSQVIDSIIRGDFPSPISHIALVDPDIVEQHNLNNQLFDQNHVSQYKAVIQQQKLKATQIQTFVHLNQIQSTNLSFEPDFAISCVDNVPARYHITSRFKQVLDFGAEGWECSIRFYGFGFHPFSSELFVTNKETICEQKIRKVEDLIYLLSNQITDLNELVYAVNQKAQIYNFKQINAQDAARTLNTVTSAPKAVHGFCVAFGLQLLKKHINGAEVPDLTNISFLDGIFVNEIYLRKKKEKVLVRGNIIVDWAEMGITNENHSDTQEYYI